MNRILSIAIGILIAGSIAYWHLCVWALGLDQTDDRVIVPVLVGCAFGLALIAAYLLLMLPEIALGLYRSTCTAWTNYQQVRWEPWYRTAWQRYYTYAMLQGLVPLISGALLLMVLPDNFWARIGGVFLLCYAGFCQYHHHPLRFRRTTRELWDEIVHLKYRDDEDEEDEKVA